MGSEQKSEGSPSALPQFGDLGGAAKHLFELVLGPGYIWRKAKAEGKAAIFKADVDAEIQRLKEQAENRAQAERIFQEMNIRSIAAGSMQHLTEFAQPEKIHPDWMANFLSKCRNISDEEMQSMWSKILAGEANSPGSVSKRTLNALNDFDKPEAEAFTAFCRFIAELEVDGCRFSLPFLFDSNGLFEEEHGLNWEKLSHLDSIGLIHLSSHSLHYQFRKPPPLRVKFYYRGQLLRFETPVYAEAIFNGLCHLTKTGEELVKYCTIEPIENFDNYLEDNRRIIEGKDSIR